MTNLNDSQTIGHLNPMTVRPENLIGQPHGETGLAKAQKWLIAQVEPKRVRRLMVDGLMQRHNCEIFYKNQRNAGEPHFRIEGNVTDEVVNFVENFFAPMSNDELLSRLALFLSGLRLFTENVQDKKSITLTYVSALSGLPADLVAMALMPSARFDKTVTPQKVVDFVYSLDPDRFKIIQAIKYHYKMQLNFKTDD